MNFRVLKNKACFCCRAPHHGANANLMWNNAIIWIEYLCTVLKQHISTARTYVSNIMQVTSRLDTQYKLWSSATKPWAKQQLQR